MSIYLDGKEVGLNTTQKLYSEYTAGNGIKIENNTISIDNNTLEQKQDKLQAGKNISLDNNKVSFVAEELELIEKRIIGYAVLNTKPSDWEENYTNYYKNSGTAKEPNYELLTEYEAWSNGKFYSFTQSPSGRITFNVETDGTPYDFSQIAVNVLIPQVTDEYGATIYVRAGDDSSIAIYETQISLGTLVASRTSNTNVLFVIKKNGNWLTANITNKSPLIYFSNNKNKLCMFQFVRDAVKPFVANSVITVYGIR